MFIVFLVSHDANIPNLLENHDFKIVISSSGLKKLIQPDTNENWYIPIEVKKITTKSNSNPITKSIVFIDKPFPGAPTQSNFHEKAYKKLVKTEFCQFKAFE